MVAGFFSELARRALVLSGLALFLEVLLPKGSLRKYARLVLGVMLAGAFIEPLAALLPGEAVVSASIFTDLPQADSRVNGYSDNTEEIIEAGSRLAEQAEAEAADALAADLERQITAFISQQADVAGCEVAVQFDAGDADGAAAASTGNNWGRVFIMLSVNEDAAGVAEEVAAKIKTNVAAFYDLSEAAVRVSLVKYGGDAAAGQ